MKKNLVASLFALAGFVGCAGKSQSLSNPTYEAQSQQEVKDTIFTIYQLVVDKKPKELSAMHDFSDKYSKFDLGTKVLELAKDASVNETKDFESMKSFRFDKNKSIYGLKTSIFGDIAISAFFLDYDMVLVDGTPMKGTARCTLAFRRVENAGTHAWKIIHEHFSPQGS